MDKKTLKVTSIHKSGDHNYWKRKPYQTRIGAVETLRRIVFGYDPFAERLQRNFAVTKLKED